ncbi:hypothetical protein [Aurantibacter sp.]|uniref:hypothetical protein n=1 Tax=Aurantibacter sp. TaxID=2807103 RepID=UPI0035C837AA
MIIIPMAGKSSRFYNAGYTLPKFMLPLGIKTVFEEAVNSFKRYFETDFFLFITRTDDNSKEFVTKKCSELKIKKYEIVCIDYDTKGQADTIAIGLNIMRTIINKNEPIYIFNIDSIRVNFLKPTSDFLENIAGYLEVFKGNGEHWSFAEPLFDNYVKRTTEKIKISDLCSNGLYYFNSVTLFEETFEKLKIVNNYNELFVAPMYNILIKKKLNVKYVLLNNNETLFSGTPKEYENLKLTFNS